jgi:hypothetical protein
VPGPLTAIEQRHTALMARDEERGDHLAEEPLFDVFNLGKPSVTPKAGPSFACRVTIKKTIEQT